MKFKSRRHRQQLFFSGLLVVTGVINVLFFLILHRPARSEYFQLQGAIERQQSEIETRKREVGRLDEISTQLETSQQDRGELFAAHFVKRDVGFSRIPNELEKLAMAAGVRKSVVNYSMSAVPQYGLYSVKIRIPVEGEYANIANFIKSLETAGTFFIIDSIDVRSNAAAGGSDGGVGLTLSLETFFYQ